MSEKAKYFHAVEPIDVLRDGKSRIELIDSMGGDLSVVNDARASFDRISDELTEKDIKLINYLIQHEHTSPLRGVTFKFRVKCPLWICRQWWKHIVASNHSDSQLGWNEKSFRYVEINDPNEFYIPQVFRQQSKSNRQATDEPLNELDNSVAIELFETQCKSSYSTYEYLLNIGVGREQARGVLVPAVYTNFVWTTSLQSALHFIALRKGKGAQAEIAAYAEAVETLIEPIVPQAIKAWEQKK